MRGLQSLARQSGIRCDDAIHTLIQNNANCIIQFFFREIRRKLDEKREFLIETLLFDLALRMELRQQSFQRLASLQLTESNRVWRTDIDRQVIRIRGKVLQ